jgi:hypothetical protein
MPKVRDQATLRLSEPVSGKRRYKRNLPTNQSRASVVEVELVDPALMAAAQAALRPGERLVVVSATEVRTVYMNGD